MFLYSIETWEQEVDREFSWNLSLELSQAENWAENWAKSSFDYQVEDWAYYIYTKKLYIVHMWKQENINFTLFIQLANLSWHLMTNSHKK